MLYASVIFLSAVALRLRCSLLPSVPFVRSVGRSERRARVTFASVVQSSGDGAAWSSFSPSFHCSTAELTAGWLFANPFSAAGSRRGGARRVGILCLLFFASALSGLSFFLSVPPSLQHREVCGKEVAPHCLADYLCTQTGWDGTWWCC